MKTIGPALFFASALLVLHPVSARPLQGGLTETNQQDSTYSGVCTRYPNPQPLEPNGTKPPPLPKKHEYFTGLTQRGSLITVDWTASVVTTNRLIDMSMGGDPLWSKIAINIVTKKVKGCKPGTFRSVPDRFVITVVWPKKGNSVILKPQQQGVFTQYAYRVPTIR